MLKRPLVIAIIATTLTSAALATKASANGDPALGALLGAGVGAAIGNSVNYHNGAWVGGAIGALAGASIAANAGGYYDPAYGYVPDYYGACAGVLLATDLLLRAGAGVLRPSGRRIPVASRLRGRSVPVLCPALRGPVSRAEPAELWARTRELAGRRPARTTGVGQWQPWSPR